MSIFNVLHGLVTVAVPLSIETIRATVTEDYVLFEGVRDDRHIVMKVKTKVEAEGLDGQFGMGSLKILKGYVETFNKIGSNEKKPIKIDVQKNNKSDPTLPTDIHFSIKGHSTALYRLMKDNLPQQPTIKEGIRWEVVIDAPAKQKITEMQQFASILSDVDKAFSLKVEDKSLKFFIGEEASSISKVNITVAELDDSNIKLSPQVFWNCSDFISIMNLFSPYPTTVKFSNMGIIGIISETEALKFEFVLPGFKK